MNRWLAIGAAAGVITAVVVAAANVGIDLPKIATQQHVAEHAAKDKVVTDRLAGEVQSAKVLSLENAIAREELRAGNLEIQAGELRKLGIDSRALETQARLLRKSVQKRERELNKLED